MACAYDSNEELTQHQPLDQVTRVKRGEHQLTVDGQDKYNTVVKLLSKGRRNNKENAQPRSSRAIQTQLPVELPILTNLTNIRSTSKLSRLEEEREE